MQLNFFLSTKLTKPRILNIINSLSPETRKILHIIQDNKEIKINCFDETKINIAKEESDDLQNSPFALKEEINPVNHQYNNLSADYQEIYKEEIDTIRSHIDQEVWYTNNFDTVNAKNLTQEPYNGSNAAEPTLDNFCRIEDLLLDYSIQQI